MADQRLIEYIRGAQAIGQTKDDIFKALLSAGYTVDAIMEAFFALSPRPAAQAPMEAPIPETPVLPVSEKAPAPVLRSEGDDTQKRTIRIVVLIGALLIGLGIFSAIAANWEAMSKFQKVVLILISMLAAYAAAWSVERRGYAKTAEGLYLLGTLIYGGAIFLVAQIFHIRAEWPDGFLLWMVGALAVAAVLQSNVIYALGIVLGLIGIAGYPLGIMNTFGGSPFLMTSSLLLFVSAAVCFKMGLGFKRLMPSEIADYY